MMINGRTCKFNDNPPIHGEWVGHTCRDKKKHTSRSAPNDIAIAGLTAKCPNERRSLPASTISMADKETTDWPHNVPLFNTNNVDTLSKINFFSNKT